LKSSAKKISLTSVDDLFSTEESRVDEQREKIVEVPLSELHPFKAHPFKVIDNEAMFDTAESIKQYGVLVPAIARPREDGGYELVSGHRRKRACELAALETMPVIIRNLDDDAATIIMVDSNLQRENILPSERAFAFKLKLEAIKRQGSRTDLTSSQVGTKLEGKRSDQIVAQQAGESRNQIQRYIRLMELAPPLLQMVDDKKIAFNPAVELSYLPPELQTELLDIMEQDDCTPSLSQAQRLKQAAQEGKLDRNGIALVMSEEKPQQNNVTIKGNRLEKYFPKDYTPKQKEDIIIKALDLYYKKLERTKQEKEYER
jgi:ParB family chromosome partitioning protein